MSPWDLEDVLEPGVLRAASCHQAVVNIVVMNFLSTHGCSFVDGPAGQISLVVCRRGTTQNLAWTTPDGPCCAGLAPLGSENRKRSASTFHPST